jgi:hypothetical protein
MKKVEDYRRHADECRAMIKQARSPEERAMLVTMAETWEALAVSRQAQIDRQKRLRELDQVGQASDGERREGS